MPSGPYGDPPPPPMPGSTSAGVDTSISLPRDGVNWDKRTGAYLQSHMEPRFMASPLAWKPQGDSSAAFSPELLDFASFGGAAAGASLGALPKGV